MKGKKLFKTEIAKRFGDVPYVAVSDDGEVTGFFCYSFNNETKEVMLKFVVVDPEARGKGIAREMLSLAVKQAFETSEAVGVQLNVFPENQRAKKCYEKVGFVERNLTPNAFTYKDESWGRCNMIFRKELNNPWKEIRGVMESLPNGKALVRVDFQVYEQ